MAAMAIPLRLNNSFPAADLPAAKAAPVLAACLFLFRKKILYLEKLSSLNIFLLRYYTYKLIRFLYILKNRNYIEL